MLVRTTFVFALSLILVLQIFSVTQFGSTGIAGSQDAFAQTSGSAQPSYTLYQNNNEGVSIEYPSDWTYSEQTQGGRMITSFSPHGGSPTLVELFYDKNTAYVGTDQQKLDRLPQIISKVCSGASIARLGFACSDFQYKTGIAKYHGIPSFVMDSSMRETFSDGSTREQDMSQFLVITQNSDYGILVSCPKDECDNYNNELNHFVQSLNIYSVKAAANDYSNYSLLQGEWIKYKMYLKVESNDNLLQQQMQDTMAKLFSGFAGQQVKSFDDIDWIKSTVTSVSTNEITTHGEAQVLGKHVDIGDYSLDKSPSSAIPTGAKVGDTFDSPLSSAGNPSKITVTDIKTENILGNSVDVYELTSSKTTPGDTMTTQMNQVVHYDTKTGILLDWTLGMKIYNSTTFANVEFGVVPIEWSQLPGASAQTPSYNIPSWIKNTAKWWSEGSVTDDDFVKGIQYLVQQGIIVVPTTQVSSQSSQTIPSWVKNTAKWWSEGQLGDSDFVQGIQYLVQNGIIVTQDIGQAQTAVTDSQGIVSFQIKGQSEPFTFVDNATGSPLSGLDVAFALDPKTQSVGMLLIVDPTKHYPLQIITLAGSTSNSNVNTSWENSLIPSAYAEVNKKVMVSVFSDPRTVGSLLLVGILGPVGAEVGDKAATLYTLTSLVAKAADKNGWLPVSSILENHGFLTGTSSLEKAKEEIQTENEIGKTMSGIFLVGTGGLDKQGYFVGRTLDKTTEIMDMSTVSGCNPQTEEIKWVQIGFTRIYSCTNNKASGLLKYDPPNESGHVSLDLLSKANKGFGERIQADKGQSVPVPADDYKVQISAPDKTPVTEDVTVPPDQTTTIDTELPPIPSNTGGQMTSTITPAGDLSGHWSGTFSMKDTTSDGCSFTGTWEATLTQHDNDLSGSFSIVDSSSPDYPANDFCTLTPGTFNFEGGTVSSSSFQFDTSGVGEFHVKGYFTSDLIHGNFNECYDESCASGSFTGSRAN